MRDSIVKILDMDKENVKVVFNTFAPEGSQFFKQDEELIEDIEYWIKEFKNINEVNKYAKEYEGNNNFWSEEEILIFNHIFSTNKKAYLYDMRISNNKKDLIYYIASSSECSIYNALEFLELYRNADVKMQHKIDEALEKYENYIQAKGV